MKKTITLLALIVASVLFVSCKTPEAKVAEGRLLHSQCIKDAIADAQNKPNIQKLRSMAGSHKDRRGKLALQLDKCNTAHAKSIDYKTCIASLESLVSQDPIYERSKEVCSKGNPIPASPEIRRYSN